MHSGFLQDLAIVMAVAGLVTLLFHYLKQPVVLGYILAGVIIGPNTPPFPLVHDRHTIEQLSELGVILLMFGLGLHFSLKKLASVGPTALIAATLEILIMVVAGYGLGRAFGWSPMTSLFLGAILSISSTTIIIKALQELGLAKAPFASLVFGILIVEDLLAIAMLAVLSGVATTGGMRVGELALTLGKLATFLAVVLVFGLLTVPALVRAVDRFRSGEMLLVVALALCFGVSLLALKMGYSVALGAFLIGAVVAETRERGKIEALVEPVRDMFAAVFFVAIGMLIDPRVLWDHAGAIAAITAAVVAGKVVACGLGAFAAGNDVRTSLRVGMSLAQIGEFSFIIASLGLTLKVTDDFLYPVAVAVSAITTLLTPYLVRSADPLVGWFDRAAPARLTSYLDLYTRWVAHLRRGGGAAPLRRRLLWKWAFQLGLNVMLITGILVAAAAAGQAGAAAALPAWMDRAGGAGAAAWLAGTLLTLPLLIATLRKLRAVAMALAEMAVTRAAAGPGVAAVRAVVANTILTVGIVLLVLWGLALTSAILPPWPVLITLVCLVGAVAAVMQRSFIRVYARAQGQLVDTLNAPPPPAHAPPPAPQLLPGLDGGLGAAELRAVPLPPGGPAAGRLIRELALRTHTGATVVAIDRPDAPLVNPGPDEELRPGDRVYLLGTPDQLARAAAALAGPTVRPGPDGRAA
jgi:CPA2 family monovalent cation:H+ antiporter-2